MCIKTNISIQNSIKDYLDVELDWRYYSLVYRQKQIKVLEFIIPKELIEFNKLNFESIINIVTSIKDYLLNNEALS